ncbi:hydrolase 1, exosortase A system-associated [Altererythrobacter indicus]|uniref:Hydrolase 1, exosortase A system-associated n=1 Tax=Altericroceibacterium indicum TaxID=374177 RepID=A0A845A9X7_9SPHN|nr:hydrolase 1, exosortase A system-associated [Altericroceibacterium indicum]
MSREHITFDCEGETLTGTIDHGKRSSGLLIVSGGNEIRSGTFSGQAKLTAEIAAQGFPCFRFDRRGVGDSSGINRGFTQSAKDIAAAVAIFREKCPSIKRLVAFGNCDAATALVLFAPQECDTLVLANPWTLEDGQDGWQPMAIRERYAKKLRNPSEWLRLVKGQVSLRDLTINLFKVLQKDTQPLSLAKELIEKLQREPRKTSILIAERDRTGQAFLSYWTGGNHSLSICNDASHAFVEPHARQWLRDKLIASLEHEEARQFDMGGPTELSDGA